MDNSKYDLYYFFFQTKENLSIEIHLRIILKLISILQCDQYPKQSMKITKKS